MVLAIRLVKGTEHAMLDHVVLANGFTGSLPNDPVRAGRTGQASSRSLPSARFSSRPAPCYSDKLSARKPLCQSCSAIPNDIVMPAPPGALTIVTPGSGCSTRQTRLGYWA